MASRKELRFVTMFNDQSNGLFRRHDGDHEEADCKERNWAKTQAHNYLADQLKQFLVECGFRSVSVE